jgi:DNA-directed RNA polymerase subunit RPC12/RpoP
MKCKSCGAPIEDKNLTVIQGGVMAKCPYCGAVFALEEAPKW